MRRRVCTGAVALLLLAGAFPSLPSRAAPPEAELARRVDERLAQMTPAEKIDLLSGAGGSQTRGLARLGIPVWFMSDGPAGAHVPNPSSAFAAGVALAASWDTALALEVGTQIGRDARSRGAHFLLGPGVNLARLPVNGRNAEYFGEDPWLASRIAVAYIQGVQSTGVSATVKHFMGNNAEYDRNQEDSRIDERTMREIYLPVFEAAVKEAHVGAVMSAYNLTNGEHMSQNRALDTDILKREWGFDGVLMSDWESTYDGVAAANAGLDLEMPAGAFMNGATLLPALRAGKITMDTLDDKVRRQLRLAERLGWFERPQLDLDVPRDNERARVAAEREAEEGMVLLKNTGVLPLDRAAVHTLAVLGPAAYPGSATLGGSGHVQPFDAVSALSGLSHFLGPDGRVLYARALATPAQLARATPWYLAPTGEARGVRIERFDNEELRGEPEVSTAPVAEFGHALDFNAPASEPEPEAGEARAPGDEAMAAQFAAMRREHRSLRVRAYYRAERDGEYVIALEESSRFRLLLDGQVLLDASVAARAALNQRQVHLAAGPHELVVEHFRGPAQLPLPDFVRLSVTPEQALVAERARQLAARADAVVVAVGFDAATEGEGQDREFELPPGQAALIREIARINPRTVVVVTSGGSVATEGWLAGVPALVASWYAGEEGGTALARLLFGEANFSGHLPISWERQLADNPAANHYYYADREHRRIEYVEGVFMGYRGFERAGTAPRFPFGFGLSYTTFAYSDLSVARAPGPEALYEVSFVVRNTGARAGAAVPQLYIGDRTGGAPARARQELKGFARVMLEPGQSVRVRLPLSARAFTYFDVRTHRWRAPAGRYALGIGASAADQALSGEIRLPQALSLAP